METEKKSTLLEAITNREDKIIEVEAFGQTFKYYKGARVDFCLFSSIQQEIGLINWMNDNMASNRAKL